MSSLFCATKNKSLDSEVFSKWCLFALLFSFVRSVTMDKWKDIELEKMKVLSSSFKTEWHYIKVKLYTCNVKCTELLQYILGSDMEKWSPSKREVQSHLH